MIKIGCGFRRGLHSLFGRAGDVTLPHRRTRTGTATTRTAVPTMSGWRHRRRSWNKKSNSERRPRVLLQNKIWNVISFIRRCTLKIWNMINNNIIIIHSILYYFINNYLFERRGGHVLYHVRKWPMKVSIFLQKHKA